MTSAVPPSSEGDLPGPVPKPCRTRCGKCNNGEVTVAVNGFENNLTPFTITFLALPNTHDLITGRLGMRPRRAIAAGG